jgi:hypothetical protein
MQLIFATPWLLSALVALPLIWWLLKVTPPAPKLMAFPPMRLLFGLSGRQETPAHTPPWLIALRLALATLLIVALSEPLLNPETRAKGVGPLILAVDDGWAAARHWERRQKAMVDVLERAGRDDRAVILLTTAPPETADGPAPTAGRLMRADEALTIVRALAPKPWPVDRAAALAALAGVTVEDADVLWLSDGIEDGAAQAFAERLRRFGALRVMLDDGPDRAQLLLPPAAGPGPLVARVLRASGVGEETVWLKISGEDGAIFDRAAAVFRPGERIAEAEFTLPIELRNRMTRMVIEGQRGAASVVLFDERWRRRPVGLVSGEGIEADQPLLSELYYLERALDPLSEVRKGDLESLLSRPLAVLVLADVARLIGNDRGLVEDWLEAGGVLVRFAGPRLAKDGDDLVPVALRGGGRVLGGALSWSEPARLAPFAEDSPFAGLVIPPDVQVRRQVLAEPSLELAEKTWVRLEDGTPLVTAEKRGRGWLVLIHTTASTAWSDLAISGLFVEMLQRLVRLSQGVSGDSNDSLLAPLSTLDGFGRLGAPPSTSRPIAARGFNDSLVGPNHPPGYYGAVGERRALNLAAGVDRIEAIDTLPDGVDVRAYGVAGETALKPWLLAAAMMLALIDMMAGLALRGLLPAGLRRGTVALGLLLLAADPTAAQGSDDDFVLRATLETRLAYILTGDDRVDSISRSGLEGLGYMLSTRTSIEPASPMAIDIERDELIFFPLIYWPIIPSQAALSPDAVAKIDQYLKTGGIILFDTRDQNAGPVSLSAGMAPGAQALRELLKDIAIPPLTPVPPDHVLTKAFYLLNEFPGRWTGGVLWVERHEGGINDGVSSLIIGSHDWAAAWALDDRRRPMFAVVPGGERQREMAFRFGINLAMYAMTGNYKADQVHLPAILERLGQ